MVLPTSPSALLPEALDGWVRDSAPTALADPAQADPANAAALKEYDYNGGASATYKREGETLSIRALRFQDATGAYGAYSFYRQNGWLKEDIGAGATSFHNRVLFWKGDTVVDATFSHIGTMSAAEMRELAHHIPDPPGTRALMPPVLANLPQARAGRADNALCDRASRLRRFRRRAAPGSGWLRSRRRGRHRELQSHFRACHAHHH